MSHEIWTDKGKSTHSVIAKHLTKPPDPDSSKQSPLEIKLHSRPSLERNGQ